MQKAMQALVQKATYTVGEAAYMSDVSAKMIRHYEQIGLLKEAARTDAGYRSFTEADVRVLVFIRMSRALGLSRQPSCQVVTFSPANCGLSE